MDILFFSRGRGRGHAIPDIAIMEKLRNMDPTLSWQFVSYGTGAATFLEFGYEVLDIHLPDDNPFLETVVRASDAIRQLSPRLVIAHEEFAALLAAKVNGIPSIFITDWFLNENYAWMQTLAFANVVLFLEVPGVFDEPSYVKGKVEYIGPFVRDLSYGKQDKQRARRELGIDQESIVLSVLPGGWATEHRAPIADLLLPAFDGLERSSKMLFWVAGEDFEALTPRTVSPNFVVLKKMWPIEQLMIASNIVITKGNRVTIMESAELGVPSISLSHGLNQVEDFIVSRIRTNLNLRVKGTTSGYLTKCMQNILSTTGEIHESSNKAPTAEIVAKTLLNLIRKEIQPSVSK